MPGGSGERYFVKSGMNAVYKCSVHLCKLGGNTVNSIVPMSNLIRQGAIFCVIWNYETGNDLLNQGVDKHEYEHY